MTENCPGFTTSFASAGRGVGIDEGGSEPMVVEPMVVVVDPTISKEPSRASPLARMPEKATLDGVIVSQTAGESTIFTGVNIWRHAALRFAADIHGSDIVRGIALNAGDLISDLGFDIAGQVNAKTQDLQHWRLLPAKAFAHVQGNRPIRPQPRTSRGVDRQCAFTGPVQQSGKPADALSRHRAKQRHRGVQPAVFRAQRYWARAFDISRVRAVDIDHAPQDAAMPTAGFTIVDGGEPLRNLAFKGAIQRRQRKLHCCRNTGGR